MRREEEGKKGKRKWVRIRGRLSRERERLRGNREKASVMGPSLMG